MESCFQGPQSTRMAFWSKLKRGLGTQKELDYSEGTVPYLGTILNHLASLHHHKDKDSKNDFKVMALLREPQGACQELHVVPEGNILSWFTNLKRLSPSESCKLCKELEPPSKPVSCAGRAGRVRRAWSRGSAQKITRLHPKSSTAMAAPSEDQ
ncbi:ral guanine nucleotide dissociation stimulator-like isoform 1-T4 [Thomomys bottae]